MHNVMNQQKESSKSIYTIQYIYPSGRVYTNVDNRIYLLVQLHTWLTGGANSPSSPPGRQLLHSAVHPCVLQFSVSVTHRQSL